MSSLLLENIWIESRLVSGAIHTSELDRSEIDLSPKRECERSNANWDRSKIDLNECEHFLKANWDRSEDRSQIDPTWFDLSVNGLSMNWNIEPISPLCIERLYSEWRWNFETWFLHSKAFVSNTFPDSKLSLFGWNPYRLLYISGS